MNEQAIEKELYEFRTSTKEQDSNQVYSMTMKILL